MSAQRSNSVKAEMTLPAPASASVDLPGDGLRLLGEALSARTRTCSRARSLEHGHPSMLWTRPSRKASNVSGMASTAAVASWMAGQSLEAAREVGMETWHIFGQLAAERVAPLNEVTQALPALARRRGRCAARERRASWTFAADALTRGARRVAAHARHHAGPGWRVLRDRAPQRRSSRAPRSSRSWPRTTR